MSSTKRADTMMYVKPPTLFNQQKQLVFSHFLKYVLITYTERILKILNFH